MVYFLVHNTKKLIKDYFIITELIIYIVPKQSDTMSYENKL